MPCGRKRKRHKIATHKRKKRLRKNRHKKKAHEVPFFGALEVEKLRLVYRRWLFIFLHSSIR